MRTKHLFLVMASGLALLTIPTHAQRYTYWNQLVKWNGVTHWSQYMRYAPAFFGPNALPVPEIPDAEIKGNSYAEGRLVQHNIAGDLTTNLFLKAVFPLGNSAQFELSGVPLEYYQMDSATRDLRRGRNPERSGWAMGDLIFGTRAQLFNQRGGLPDVSIGFYARTASGGKLDDARFTDAPGYWFDLTAGEEVGPVIGRRTWIRWKATLGFYSWQTAADDYRQNDAVLAGGSFGIGEPSKYWMDISLSGYFGYMGNGDQPIVLRLQYQSQSSKFPKGLGWSIQQGLQNYPFTSIAMHYRIPFTRWSVPKWYHENI